MKIEIRYYSKSGNTKKLALAISEELNIIAKTVEENLEEKCDILFLGSAVYAFAIDEEVKKFIETNKDKIGKIVNFSNAALVKGTYKAVKKCAEKNGVEIDSNEFHCKGSFKGMNKNRPNEEDINNLKEFVRNYMKGIE